MQSPGTAILPEHWEPDNRLYPNAGWKSAPAGKTA